MSDDFITLQCPNCGGSLRIGKNVTEYRCESCGVEHLVRQTAAGVTLETHARCPVCHRNDRVEKVSSILNRQVKSTETVLTKLLMPPKPPQFDSMPGPARGTFNLASCGSFLLFLLAAGLMLYFFVEAISPRDHTPVLALVYFISFISFGLVIAGIPFVIGLLLLKKGSANWARYSSILLFILSAGLLAPFIYGTFQTSNILFFRYLLLLVILAAPAGVGLLLLKKVAPKVQEKIDAKNEAESERIASLNADRDWQMQAWENALERHRKLYYCQRDDVVFILGETESVPVNQMKDLLFK